MKNRRMRNLKEAGITLVALVVTIIVLLILAGVTINLALSNNGIIQRAKDASEAHKQGVQNETESMAYMEEAIDGLGTVTPGKKVSIKAGTGAGTDLKTAIANGTNLNTLYTQPVDYTSEEGITWQLFYDDDTNIYLIASDYVPIDTLPNELIKETQAEGEIKYIAWFASGSSPNYTGDIMTKEPWSAGTESSTITSNPLTSTYLKWVNSSVVSKKNNPNMKSVAYMMDTSKWSNFAGEAKGAKAMGGPTVEMFALSYNSKHDTKLGTYGTSASDIVSTGTNANAGVNGYKVKIGEGSWTTNVSGLDRSSDNMWVKTRTGKASGMWVASPSANSASSVYKVLYNGNLDDNYGSNISYGFRPVVSIPKSSIQ